MIDDLFKTLEAKGVLNGVPNEMVEDAKAAVHKAEKSAKKARKKLEEVILASQDTDEVPMEVQEIPVRKAVAKVSQPKQVYETYEDFDYENLLTYAGLDCIVTSEVLSKIFPLIVEEPEFHLVGPDGSRISQKAPAIIKSVSEIEMKAHEFIIDLEINGLKYDCDRNRQFSRRMVQEIGELEEKIFTAVGKHINLDSGDEVSELLYAEKGFEPPFLTKSGAPSTDGEALLTLAGLDPMGGKYVCENTDLQFLADMAKRKDINSVHNTFIKTYIEDFVKRDGRIHPSYNLHGTSSFRITGDNPNLTQLPRPKHGYNVRECYIVEEGYVFLSFDFSSAEVKILGALCKDPNILKAIREGLDFHSFSASAMKGISYEDFMYQLEDKSRPHYKEYKALRQISKILTFSILYGSSVAGIAMQLNMSKEKAQELVDMYFKAYPGVADYVMRSHKMAEWNQYVITPFGQRKREYGSYPVFKNTAAYNASFRNAQNVIVQSTTSTLGLITFAHLNEQIKKIGGKSICTVYDSIELEVPINVAAEAIEIAFYCMNEWPIENFDFLSLPVGVEGDCGLSWGKTELVHRGITQQEVESLITTLKNERN